MGVLLGLGDVELADAVLGQHLRDRLGDVLLLERDRAVEVVPVAGHRRQVEPAVEEPLGELAGPVGPEVEEDRGVRRPEPRARQHDGLDELVRDAGVVARLDRGHRVFGRSRLARDDRGERAVRPVPALVAVHRVVAAADGRDPDARVDQLGEVVDARRAARRRGRR